MFCCTAARPQQWACLPLVLVAPTPTRAGTNLGVQNDRIGISHLRMLSEVSPSLSFSLLLSLIDKLIGWMLVGWLVGWLVD